MTAAAWGIAAFLSGSIPYSVWAGRLFLGKEIRSFGDGNPGGTNVVRAGGGVLGPVVILLDVAKGLLPVYWAQSLGGLGDWPTAAVALAAVAGHAFSPLLGFRGGKAVAVTFGVWTGAAGWGATVVLGVCLLLAYVLIAQDGWSVAASMCGLLLFLIAYESGPPTLAVWLGNVAILSWKHRAELTGRPALRHRTAR